MLFVVVHWAAGRGEGKGVCRGGRAEGKGVCRAVPAPLLMPFVQVKSVFITHEAFLLYL